MADLMPRCVPVAVPQPSAQSWCPESHILTFTEQPTQPLFISGDELEAAGAIGAAALLFPWLAGRAYAVIAAIIDERINA